MKFCANCGASSPDRQPFCGECGKAFPEPAPAPPDPPVRRTLRADEEAPSPDGSGPWTAARKAMDLLAGKGAVSLYGLERGRQADIVFVLDCTESMKGELAAIKTTMAEFAESIDRQGVRARVALVEYRDRLIDEETVVHRFAGQVFTNDPSLFSSTIEPVAAQGGGDEPESTLDALMTALGLPFREDSSKVLVLITDAPPHIPDRDTPSMEAVQSRMTERGLDQLYIVTRLADPRCMVYLKLLQQCRGLAFELGRGDDFRQRAEHFKRTLMNLGKTISAATRS